LYKLSEVIENKRNKTMASILTDLGEEYIITEDLTTDSVAVGLYDDSVDNISDPDDLASITTEPRDGNYTRQSNVPVSAVDISGNFGINNDGKVTFDLQDTTPDVDSYFFVANFNSSVAGDSSAQDHLILTGSLSQTYDLNSVDSLEIASGTAGVTID